MTNSLIKSVINIVKESGLILFIIAVITVIGSYTIGYFLGKNNVDHNTINLANVVWILVIIGISFKVFSINK